MDCAQFREYLDGYLDHELDAVTAGALERHLQSCSSCKRAYEARSSLRAAVGRHATYYTAAGDLARRVRTAIGVDRATGAGAGWRRLQWLPLGAAVAVTAVVTWMATLHIGAARQDEAIVEQIVAGHSRAVLTNHLADVASSDQHTVKPWLSARLDFSPPVVDLTSGGYPLAGGRLDYLESRTVAALIYHHRQHVINLFIWPKANPPAALRTFSRQGYNVLNWGSAGMTFWAISDLNAEDLAEFARLFRHQAAAPAAKLQSLRPPPA